MDQIDPGEIQGETVSGVSLPHPNINIKESIENAVKEISENINITISVNKKGQVCIPWPTRKNEAMSEFTTRQFFSLAFPSLFPYGNGDFHLNRARTCTSLSDWANHLIWSKDGRFANQQFFKFILHNIIMRKRVLEQSTFIVQQKLGDSHLTLSELKEKLQTGDQSIANKILYFSENLRGTSQYWNQRSKDLRALIQFKINEGHGLPSFFTTGSCTEFYFKSLKRLLSMYIKETTEKNVNLDDHNQMFTAVQENSHIVADFFDRRTQNYFTEVMAPVFGVDTYWYRQEFPKSRSMIHWHGLCWRSDHEPHSLLHEGFSQGKTSDECAALLSEWAKNTFKMTASHPAGGDESGNPNKNLWAPPEGTCPAPPAEKKSPCKITYGCK